MCESYTDSEEFAQWRRERNEALRTLNMAHFRQQFKSATDEVLLMSMHKARYECTGIEAPLRLESGEWLRERGYGRYTGGPILPGLELPE